MTTNQKKSHKRIVMLALASASLLTPFTAAHAVGVNTGLSVGGGNGLGVNVGAAAANSNANADVGVKVPSSARQRAVDVNHDGRANAQDSRAAARLDTNADGIVDSRDNSSANGVDRDTIRSKTSVKVPSTTIKSNVAAKRSDRMTPMRSDLRGSTTGKVKSSGVSTSTTGSVDVLSGQ